MRITKNGSAHVLHIEDIPIPLPGKGEVLIHLSNAGLNAADIFMRERHHLISLPFTPGLEGSGIVEAVAPDVKGFKLGSRVAYAGQLGSYAEYVIVKASQLVLLPPEINFEVGAALLFQGVAAHYLLHKYYHGKPGDQVLIQAAASGIGLILTQWLKHLGAHVVATVSTEKKAKAAFEAGADEVVFNTDVENLSRFGYTQGGGLFTQRSYLIEHLRLYNKTSSPYQLSTNFQNRAQAVIEGIQEGWLNIKIFGVFPLAQAAKAQQFFEDRRTVGKIILRISEQGE